MALVLIPLQSFAAPALQGVSEGQRWEVTKVTGGLGSPWGMAWIAPGQLIITQRPGTAIKLDLNTGQQSQISGLPEVADRGQGGLLDVAISPNSLSIGHQPCLYFTYSKPTQAGAVTALARARLTQNSLTNWQDLLVTDSATSTSRHFGSRIAFDQQGHVFFSVGDRGERPNGQDLTTHAGSILRLYLDGSVPGSNPFVNQAPAHPEIWSYGHRNPQGLAYDPEHQRLWAIEHGPRGGDEINLILKGRNYGWPVTSHGKEYWGPLDVGEAEEKPGIESPRTVYVPSIAPGSLLLYTGDAFPKWRGNLFAGALKLQHINRIAVSDEGNTQETERLVGALNERIRALLQSPEGWIYFATDSGNLYRLAPAG
ncbi:PQQ-dependent sugar dehydrogenase [Photobacterium sp. MCCC 1A19761]|uniref:PQQ-dependent sugar dehydrogenase n=1 Tax=Photobacterium sp. MCCC 1A19761 TaxID=3115000 RepID=UPI003FCCA4C9